MCPPINLFSWPRIVSKFFSLIHFLYASTGYINFLKYLHILLIIDIMPLLPSRYKYVSICLYMGLFIYLIYYTLIQCFWKIEGCDFFKNCLKDNF